MDPVYGTKRRAVPLLVEDVNQGETSVDVKSINSKMDDLNGKIEALNNTIKSTAPMGCYTHYRYRIDDEEGNPTWREGGELDNTPNLLYTTASNNFKFLVVNLLSATTNSTVQIVSTTSSSSPYVSAYFPITKTTEVELYNPFDFNVLQQRVTSTAIQLKWPIHLKTPIPYPSTSLGSSGQRANFFPNGSDVFAINKAIGATSSTGNTVIGLLKSISNKL